MSDEVGLDFVHVNGMSGEWFFVEMVGAGCGLLDYDGDGDLDLYLAQGHSLGGGEDRPDAAPIDRLYRNDMTIGTDGTRTLRFTDVTEPSALRATGYGMGVAAGDYNNDGHVDLYVINWGSNQLWRNNGDGSFSDVTDESGTDDPRWSTGASFVDFDLDGWLDLVVVNYVVYTLEQDHPCYAETGEQDYCGPEAYPPDRDLLLRNRGDGSFEDVTLRVGLSASFGPALGVITADFDDDGWPDIYVANDGDENQLWINQNGERFQNRAVLAGAAVNTAGMAEASMGVSAADFDGDGDEDLFMTHLIGETNTLYVNAGEALFEDLTRSSGLAQPSRGYTGFGVAPLDYDNDGWLDLFIANGDVRAMADQRGEALPLRQRNQLFRNLGRGRFEEVIAAGEVFERAEVSRGIAYGDVDNDGDADVLLTNNNGRARLLRNDVGHEKRWIGLRLVGGPGRDMPGARIEIRRPGRASIWRRAHADGSWASAHDPRVLIGLDDEETYVSALVRWPGGRVEVWERLEVSRYHTLVEATGRLQETSE